MTPSGTGRFLRWAAAIAVVLVVLLVVAYNLLGGAVRKAVERFGPEVTGATVTLKDVDLSLFSGRVGLNGLVLGNPPGFSSPSAFSLDRLRVNVGLGSLFGDVLVIKRILVKGAAATWEGYGGDNHRRILQNVQSFASRSPKGKTGGKTGSAARTGPGRKVIIDDILLTGCTVSVWQGGHEIGRVEIPEIHLTGIGRAKGGVTFEEAAREIYTPLAGC